MALSWIFRALKNRTPNSSLSTGRSRFRPRLELLEDRMAPATFTVLNTNNDGPGSLRFAVSFANAAVGADTIDFNIPGPGVKTINLASPLPILSGKVTIAGPTALGLPQIELNGALAGPGANGLVMKAAGCVVRSLIINNFQGNGILALGASGVVEGCFIGTNSTGFAAAANQFYGVLVTGTATGVRIGSTTLGLGNVISGNALSGVAILGTLTKSNVVQGNFIGTNRLGNAAIANGFDGVAISGGAKSNVIGGAAAGAGNVISGNGSDGVQIDGVGTTANVLLGNYIGINLAGNAGLGNAFDGVSIKDGAANNTVGGTVPGARNVISKNSTGVEITGAGSTGNKVQGNFIGTNALGNADLGNNLRGVRISGAANNTIGGTVAAARNVISGNDAQGVLIFSVGATGNVVLGNFIGTDVLGNTGVGNTQSGVSIGGGAVNNTVGGTVAGARNVISGNLAEGVFLFDAGTTGNKVLGNFIGANATGTADLGNALEGVVIASVTNNTVGGTVAGARNVISGNNSSGVRITGVGATGNKVLGNYIGASAAGNADLGNSIHGVLIDNGAAANTVGGSVAGARNIISGNDSNGVQITGAGTDNNLVLGNYIGTNAAGTGALTNTVNGVAILGGATQNTVGGSVPLARNVISGNNVEGVVIAGVGTDNNSVGGNYIGTNAAGTGDLGNGFDGVAIQLGAAHNAVGVVGLLFHAPNVISGNDRCGVFLWTAATNNFVAYNAIGLAANGTTALPNASHGIIITQNAVDNIIVSNRIAHNGGDGVLIGSDPAAGFAFPAGSGNTVAANSIFDNAGLGIDLGPNDGATANDVNDPDAGPNDLINTPTLTSAVLSGGSLQITGFINTEANKTLAVYFYSNTTGGQGQTPVGAIQVNMGFANTAFFTTTLTVPASVLKGHNLTATIFDELGNTSEFSLPMTIE